MQKEEGGPAPTAAKQSHPSTLRLLPARRRLQPHSCRSLLSKAALTPSPPLRNSSAGDPAAALAAASAAEPAEGLAAAVEQWRGPPLEAADPAQSCLAVSPTPAWRFRQDGRPKQPAVQVQAAAL